MVRVLSISTLNTSLESLLALYGAPRTEPNPFPIVRVECLKTSYAIYSENSQNSGLSCHIGKSLFSACEICCNIHFDLIILSQVICFGMRHFFCTSVFGLANLPCSVDANQKWSFHLTSAQLVHGSIIRLYSFPRVIFEIREGKSEQRNKKVWLKTFRARNFVV